MNNVIKKQANQWKTTKGSTLSIILQSAIELEDINMPVDEDVIDSEVLCEDAIEM